ncbi:hypothetical protein FVB43_10325 [Erwinia rhapontici]|uniref:hypothetical protein n=1 Tax=Erwinia rhapontici TaxID=55212 RepID=UPI0014383F56|nr:hypothetical protein [Erwinia rhapontici]NKG30438.1 hypothetical protein [Erwinia rhapontici]
MFIKKYINSIVSDKVSLTSAFISVLFLWAFFYLRLNELSEKITYLNAIYCALAVIGLMVDRFIKGYLNEVQSKTVAFAFTVTPLAAALIDILLYTPTWKNSYSATLLIIVVSWLCVWLAMYLIIYSWPSKKKSSHEIK